MKINYKKLVVFILVPLILGAIVGFLAVAPNKINSIIPAVVFPIVWSILYILMGISSYIVYEYSGKIDIVYIIQLIINLLWSFIFFTFRNYVLAFITIIILFILVFIMIIRFKNIKKIAGYIQIPYLIWLIIAGILNLMFII